MDKCVDAEDNIYTIENYIILVKMGNAPASIYCPYCKKVVYTKCLNSPTKKTHFSHHANETCLYKNNSYPFKKLGNHKSNEEILELKYQIFQYLYYIYDHIRCTFSIDISVEDFVNTLSKIISKGILALCGVSIELIPYIFMSVLEKYENTIYIYTSYKDINNSFINYSNSSVKDVILCISETSDNKIRRDIIKINEKFLNYNINTTPIHFFKEVTDNKLLDTLKIPYDIQDNLMKLLITCCY